MTSGYVAFLDVLGFSNLIGGGSSNEKLTSYLECVKRSIAGSDVQYVVFSDSIMLTSGDNSGESFIAIASVCSRLFGTLLQEEIAIRGAISFGSFWRSAIEKSVFVAGRAIIEAYQFEQAQDWVGIMVSPSARAQIKDLGNLCKMDGSMTTVEAFKQVEPRIQWAAYIQPSSIPFHGAEPFGYNTFDGFAVVPTSGELEPKAIRDSISESMERLNWLRSIAPTPSAQQKYAKSTQWLTPIHDLWHGVVFFMDRQREEGQR